MRGEGGRGGAKSERIGSASTRWAAIVSINGSNGGAHTGGFNASSMTGATSAGASYERRDLSFLREPLSYPREEPALEGSSFASLTR